MRSGEQSQSGSYPEIDFRIELGQRTHVSDRHVCQVDRVANMEKLFLFHVLLQKHCEAPGVPFRRAFAVTLTRRNWG